MTTTELPKLTVFEAINHARKEIYVGVTGETMLRTMWLLKAEPPAALQEWNLADVNDFRSVEFGLSPDDAEEFVIRYVMTPAPLGWRYVR